MNSIKSVKRLIDILPYEKQGYFLVRREGDRITRSLPLSSIPEEKPQADPILPAAWDKDGATGKFRCTVCGEVRLRRGQKYCHNCGSPMSETEGV